MMHQFAGFVICSGPMCRCEACGERSGWSCAMSNELCFTLNKIDGPVYIFGSGPLTPHSAPNTLEQKIVTQIRI
jgi:hypothetical protein